MYECPCACNIQCGLVKKEPSPSPLPNPELQIGSIAVSAAELNGADSDVDDSARIANRPEMGNDTVPVAPSEIQTVASASAPEDDQQVSSSVSGSVTSFLTDTVGPGTVGFIAVVAVGSVVVALSVFSVVRNVRTKHKERAEGGASGLSRVPSKQNLSREASRPSMSGVASRQSLSRESSSRISSRNEPIFASDIEYNFSDLSDSIHTSRDSMESELDRYERFKRYKAWKLMQRGGGIDAGDDFIEP